MSIELNDEVLQQIGTVAKEAVADGLKEADIASVKDELTEVVKSYTSLDDKFNDLASAEKITETGLYQAVSEKIGETVENQLKARMAEFQPSKPDVAARDKTIEFVTSATEYSNGVEIPNFQLGLPRYFDTAAATDSTVQKSVPGHAVTQSMLWTALIEQNPWRPWMTVEQVEGGSFKVPNAERKTFTKAAGDPGVQLFSVGVGTINTATVVVEEYEQNYPVSRTTLGDLSGVADRIATNIAEDYGHTQGEEIFTALKTNIRSSTSGTATQINTGVAAALPTANNILARLDRVVEAIPSPYRMGGAIHVSRQANRRIAEGLRAAGGLAGVPGTTMQEFDGFPVVLNDHLESGGAANNLSLVAGNFRRGVVLGEREALSIEQYDQTLPGALVFYARGRFIPYVMDASGLVGLVTAA